MTKNNVNHWLGINISYDELEIKKTLNGSDFKDLFKFIANGERNKSRKIDTSKDISESEFKAVINIIEKTIEESIFDGAFEEMEDEIIDTLINMREDDE
jgi:hypothetical protein|tara:strand:+ start:354 stop:650 length:297 start_codon:yes stop_codon:yes gene_type:complete